VVENLKETDYLEDLCIDWWIIFKLTTMTVIMKWGDGLFFMFAVEAARAMQKN
jgi:hypothetical protein